jgi:lipopolysaccharide biosynthesis protein
VTSPEVRDHDVAALAFYLPQFHPTPENDRWWGPGFTEWHNVVQARPQYRGHQQPMLPADLGFYDLRLADTREAQARLARDAGLMGFCMYHYWFNGRRPLGEVLDRVLTTDSPDFPFSLCWANEPWTRSWTGRTGEVLLEQRYGDDDHRRHIDWLLKVFQDRRYITVDGRPLLLVYRGTSIPNSRRTTESWRRRAKAAGFPDLYLVRVESFRGEAGDPEALGFDAAVEFQPAWDALRPPRQRPLASRVAHRLGDRLGTPTSVRIFDYGDMAHLMESRPQPAYTRFPGVTPRWDNTPRRGSTATVFDGATPDRYRRWLMSAAERARQQDPSLLFVNAWNEWAEGAYLEPCRRMGHDYLEATRQSLSGGTTT